MKLTNQCPKCESQQLIKIPGNHTRIMEATNRVQLRVESVYVTRYVCGSCGFSEEWIDSADDIAKLKNQFGA